MKRKTSTKVLCVFMAFLFVFGMLNISSANFGLKASATNKQALAHDTGWTLYTDGELKITMNISPDGEGKFPWSENADKVTYVSLGEKVTIIEDYTFAGTSIEVIYIPATVISLNLKAFCNKDPDTKKDSLISSLKTIYYGGTYDQFKALNSGIEKVDITVEYTHVHKKTVPVKVEPDCTKKADGYTGDIYCAICRSLVKEGEVIPFANAHKWSENKEIYKAATCDAGLDNYNRDILATKCTLCGAWNEDSIEYKEHIVAHDYSIVAVKSQYKCGTEGATYTAQCSVCGHTADQALPTNHTYTEENSVEASCTTPGYILRECVYCSTVFQKTEIDPKGHGKTSVKTEEATCEQSGKITTYCTVCSETISTKFISATGHNYSENWTVITKPTHTLPGYKAKLCQNKNCQSYVEGESIASHTYGFFDDTGYEYVTTLEATCSDPGVKTLVCKKCLEDAKAKAKANDEEYDPVSDIEKLQVRDDEGKVITAVIPVNKAAHKPYAEIQTGDRLDATCTTDGYEITRCEYCQQELNKVILPATGHNYELTDPKPCTSGGGEAHMTCQYCKDVQIINVPARSTHSIEKIVKNPTCTTKGYTIEKCTVPGCGYESGKYGDTAALGHNTQDSEWVLVEAATCEKNGSEERRCVRYGQVDDYDANGNEIKCTYKEVKILKATGHDFEHITEPATCTTEGREYDYCKTCKKIMNSKTLPKKPHTMVDTVTNATCENGGYTTHTCSVCKTSYQDNFTEALGHNLSDGVVVAPTCTEAGYIKYACTREGCEYAEKKPDGTTAKGHTPVIDDAVAPYCTKTGLTEGIHCSVCKAIIEEQKVVPAKGHTEVVIPAVAPTCTLGGLTEGKKCTACGEITVPQQTIVATGHTPVAIPAVAPTCTTPGKTEGTKCSVCSAIITAPKDVVATGHNIVNDAAVPATCTTKGKTAGSHCDVCNAIIEPQVETPIVDHTIVNDPAVAATCETDGKTAGSHCSVCNKIIEEQKDIKATGHDYQESYTKTEATAFKNGVKVYKCTKCGGLKEVEYKPTFLQRIVLFFKGIFSIFSL